MRKPGVRGYIGSKMNLWMKEDIIVDRVR